MARNSEARSGKRSIAGVPLPRCGSELDRAVSENHGYQRILKAALETIEHYSLFDTRTDHIIVALSGGKDSLLLTLILRDLGVNIHPITIDMGYERGWADEIAKLAQPLGITPEVIDVRRPVSGAAVAVQISRRMDILDSIPTSGSSSETPCTHCYSVKVLALETAARRDEITRVAFAHHMTDAIASLVKEGLMHVDRWDNDNSEFDRQNFELLVEQLVAESADFPGEPLPSSLTSRLVDLVHASKLDTDEPPRQPLRRGRSPIEIIRPLFLIDEHQIRKATIDLSLRTADSGCGHGATQVTQTPREIVHFRLLNSLRNQAYYSLLRELVLHGIAPNGSARVQARKQRSEMLGALYKPPTDDLDKL